VTKLQRKIFLSVLMYLVKISIANALLIRIAVPFHIPVFLLMALAAKMHLLEE
jgi:hypothetical protein